MVLPVDSMYIDQDTRFKPGVYYVPNGINILEDGITVDGAGAVLVGKARNGCAIRLHGRHNVTVKNFKLMEYKYGLDVRRCDSITIQGCQVRSSAELPANSEFLDVWRNCESSYGGAILLEHVTNSQVLECDLQHQMNGLHAYFCDHLEVRGCNASYNSGWGFHLYETQHSVFQANYADYCCRYQPRGHGHGHMGADAAGFLIVHNSSQNIFRQNNARLSGDGFFLAGLAPGQPEGEFEPCGCDENLFEANDAYFSPNISFEATFSRKNIFRNNIANKSNYGFWLGFSSDNLIEGNTIHHNHSAGIAVENGLSMRVRENSFHANQHGILLWSKRVPAFETFAPENETSRDWVVEQNDFRANQIAVRIAANQDHGIRSLPENGELGFPAPEPRNHHFLNNEFNSNGKDFDLNGDLHTIVKR